jgi:hypothetical protein
MRSAHPSEARIVWLEDIADLDYVRAGRVRHHTRSKSSESGDRPAATALRVADEPQRARSRRLSVDDGLNEPPRASRPKQHRCLASDYGAARAALP